MVHCRELFFPADACTDETYAVSSSIALFLCASWSFARKAENAILLITQATMSSTTLTEMALREVIIAGIFN